MMRMSFHWSYLTGLWILATSLHSLRTGAHPQDTVMIRAGQIRQASIDQLRAELAQSVRPEDKLRILDSLSMYYLYFSRQTDSALICATQAVDLAFPLADKRPLILAYARRSNYFWQKTNLKEALENAYHGIKLSTELGIRDYLSTHYQNLVNIYMQMGNSEQICANARLQFEFLEYNLDPFYNQEVLALANLGNCMIQQNKGDSAFHYLEMALKKSKTSQDPVARNTTLWFTGVLYHQNEKYRQADSVFHIGRLSCLAAFDNQNLDAIYWELGNNYRNMNDLDQAIRYTWLGLINSRSIQDHFATLLHYRLLGQCYEALGRQDSVLHYLKLTNEINDELFNANRVYGMNEIAFSEQMRQRELVAAQILEKEKQKSKLKLYGFGLVSLFLALAAGFQWRYRKQKQKSLEVLQIQKNETEMEKQRAVSALENLKATQAQLIQSEKMASLGELTAGIAHEIQNPLNFINNFSEINAELIEELKGERSRVKGERSTTLEESLLKNLEENERKINHHGKRADAIVKSMLLHSRNTTGQKEATDLNALCEEYLRLSYHGLKAKDKTFQAEFGVDLDPELPRVAVVPQEIGRVFLNLFNNAFYAVTAKCKALSGTKEYKPTVKVSTKWIQSASGDLAEIRIKDNGQGIPEEIREKIFQPFYTTKPTGEGTGLGLSLAYDIVTKGHGGKVEVMSEEGDGSEFIVQLPV